MSGCRFEEASVAYPRLAKGFQIVGAPELDPPVGHVPGLDR
jgi:hypothetical protein